MTKLCWSAAGPHEWRDTGSRYRLWQNAVTGNVFVYYGSALVNARYTLPDAKRLAQEHHDGRAVDKSEAPIR